MAASTAKQSTERTYLAPARQAWDAVLGAIAEQPAWRVQEQDPAAGTLTFNTGMSMSSWSGQDMTVQVVELGTGRARVLVGGKVARRGMSTFQVVSWGEKGRMAQKLLRRLDELLPAAAP